MVPGRCTKWPSALKIETPLNDNSSENAKPKWIKLYRYFDCPPLNPVYRTKWQPELKIENPLNDIFSEDWSNFTDMFFRRFGGSTSLHKIARGENKKKTTWNNIFSKTIKTTLIELYSTLRVPLLECLFIILKHLSFSAWWLLKTKFKDR